MAAATTQDPIPMETHFTRAYNTRRSWTDAEVAKGQTRYRVQRKLHSTLFGDVVLAHDTMTGQNVVIKTSNQVRVEGTENPSNEAHLMRKLQSGGGHDNLVKFISSNEDEKQVRIVMEYIPDDLFKLVSESGGVPEKTARKLFRKILAAVKYLHSKDIAHLDLSLENVLVDHSREAVKLCDFGASKEAKHGRYLKNILAGKINCASPEILDGRKVEPFLADVYSLGSILFMLLCGHPLYDLETGNGKVAMRYATSGKKALRQLITAYGYNEMHPKNPSNDAVDLIARLMAKTPSERIPLSEIENHPWFRG
mmetsp:Transcript_10460/g.20044  ORF Transcript_10460/g.20044 Transcript_10460/m.20044 type:complete len:310 (-) Transcript_10460:360-1289(-)